MLKRIFATLFLLTMMLCGSSYARSGRDIPMKLFGITLGATYDLGSPDVGDFGNIPIRKFAGINKFLGEGIHYFFEPNETSKFFTYVEKKKSPEDQFFETSFSLYLLPDLSKKSKIDLGGEKPIKFWNVAKIYWAVDADSNVEKEASDEKYYWAMDLCKTFSSEFRMKPKILDDYALRTYICTFSSDDRIFEISMMGGKSVSLEFNREKFKKLNEDVESARRSMQAKEILSK
jgi:hypothetical protein